MWTAGATATPTPTLTADPPSTAVNPRASVRMGRAWLWSACAVRGPHVRGGWSTVGVCELVFAESAPAAVAAAPGCCTATLLLLLRSGPWTTEEQDTFQMITAEHGKDWKRLTRAVRPLITRNPLSMHSPRYVREVLTARAGLPAVPVLSLQIPTRTLSQIQVHARSYLDNGQKPTNRT